MEFFYEGAPVEVERNTTSHTKVKVSKRFIGDLPVEFASEGDNATLSLDAWRLILAHRFTPETRASGDQATFAPSFRDLAIYFIRLGKDAFSDPQQAFQNQKGTSKRLAVSYMLGLNWAGQRNLHGLQAERDRIATAMKAVSEVAASTREETIGELEAERVVLEKALESRIEDVKSFNVRSDYHDLENRLGATDKALHSHINDNHSDKRLLQYYEESAADAPLLDANRPVSVLRDAGAVFRESALRSLEEVSEFHSQVYKNRSEFLKAEIQRLREAIAKRNRLIEAAASTKSQLLGVLASSGALETLIELQRSTMEMSASLEALKAKIDERKRFDRRKDELAAEIAGAKVSLKQDLDLRRDLVDEAIELFAEYTRELYGKAARLGVDIKDAGYKFTFAIDRQGSDGVDQMVVFCFDLMVATLKARRGSKFKTLIHDSSLFADVDPRQYGLALQLAARVSVLERFQYICCLNEGTLPSGHIGTLDIDKLTKLHLTDDGPKGRLLGMQLSPRDT